MCGAEPLCYPAARLALPWIVPRIFPTGARNVAAIHRAAEPAAALMPDAPRLRPCLTTPPASLWLLLLAHPASIARRCGVGCSRTASGSTPTALSAREPRGQGRCSCRCRCSSRLACRLAGRHLLTRRRLLLTRSSISSVSVADAWRPRLAWLASRRRSRRRARQSRLSSRRSGCSSLLRGRRCRSRRRALLSLGVGGG